MSTPGIALVQSSEPNLPRPSPPPDYAARCLAAGAVLVVGYGAILLYPALGMSKFGTPAGPVGVALIAVGSAVLLGACIVTQQPRTMAWFGLSGKRAEQAQWAPLSLVALAALVLFFGMLGASA